MSLSERRACSIVGADRSMIRYRSSRPEDAVLRGRLRDLANKRRRFGYRSCSSCCGGRASRRGSTGATGFTARKPSPSASGGLGAKRWGPVPRSWSRQAQRALVAGLRPRPVRQRPALPHPQHRRRGHQGMPGRHSGNVDLGRRVAWDLTAIVELRGKPEMIVSDHGSEFTSKAVLAWCKDAAIDWHFIAPEKADTERLHR